MFKRKPQQAANQPATEAAKRRSGRPLLLYFAPAVVVATLLILLAAVLAQQSIGTATARAAESAAISVATALAGRLEGEIIARRDLLTLALNEPQARKIFAAGDHASMGALETSLQQRIPGLLQVRVLASDTSQPDLDGPAPMGYAGLDMLHRTLDSGRPTPAEVHQIKSGAPYLAIALPLPVAGQKGGVLFAAWDLRPLIAVVESSPPFPGRVELLQGGDGGYVLASGPGGNEDLPAAGGVNVPQTIWKVGYRLMPETGGLDDLQTLFALAGGSVLALLLTMYLQWHMLRRDLRDDMATVVNLGEAILRREGMPPRRANLSGAADAIALLGQFARDARDPSIAMGDPARAAVSTAQTGKQARIPAAPAAQQASLGVEVEELENDPADVLGGARANPVADVPQQLFRAYDVRGIVGEELTPEIAQLLGSAVGSLVLDQGGNQVVVAGDARTSSPQLSAALIRGLVGTGCRVLDAGMAPTPLINFALHTQVAQAGVMVTGSHNPSRYNGFKIMVGDRVLDGDDLQDLRLRMMSGELRRGQGSVERIDLVGEYVEAVTREVQLAGPLKVVVDAGNGVAGDLAVATFEALGCEVTPLFCEPDGTFPNHHPDPNHPDNLAALMREVQSQGADVGFAFDGDGDRLGTIDEAGNNIWPDKVLMMLAADVLGRHPGVDILYDVKSSRHLASFVLSHGGRPIMWKSGHSRMRAKMLETGALLGGEFTGHLFIKERWFGFDDAIYAAARVLELLALDSRPASEVFGELPSSPSTPEYQLMLEEGQSPNLMRALDAHKVFDDARLVELDGLRVEFANGWGLIRPSNTTPSLTFRFEADDEDALEQIKARFRDLLRRVAPDMQAPF